MSESKKAGWLWIAAAVTASIVAAGSVLVLRADDSDGPPSASPAEVVEIGLPQAAWTLRTFAAGTAGPPSPKALKAVRREKQDLVTVVTTVADTLVSAPTEVKALAGKELSGAAAEALSRSDLAFPAGLTEIQAVRKKAAIGLDSNGSTRAAARITLLVKANADGEAVRIVADSRLYLEKRKGRWQVIAFDGTREPKRTKDKKGSKA